MGEKSKVNSDKRLAGFLSPRVRGDKGGSFSACAKYVGPSPDPTAPPSVPPYTGGGAKRRTRGNAMIYILLAIALLGGLTMTMMRGNETGGDDLSEDQKRLYATQLIAQAATAKQVIDQMVMTGSNFNNLDFVLPSDPAFNTGSNIHKFYHPAGGGMVYKTPTVPPFVNNTAPNQGWYIYTKTNVEWTPSATADVIFSAFWINLDVCAEINKIITGSNAIPQLSSAVSQRGLFTNYFNTDVTLNAARCPDCVGHSQICVGGSSASDQGTFYSIILAR